LYCFAKHFVEQYILLGLRVVNFVPHTTHFLFNNFHFSTNWPRLFIVFLWGEYGKYGIAYSFWVR